jgi:hypothetical protein
VQREPPEHEQRADLGEQDERQQADPHGNGVDLLHPDLAAVRGAHDVALELVGDRGVIGVEEVEPERLLLRRLLGVTR